MNIRQGIGVILTIVSGSCLGWFIMQGKQETPQATTVAMPETISMADMYEINELPLQLSELQIAEAGIHTSTAESARISQVIAFPGEISFDRTRTAHVLPLASGVVKAVSVELGQKVKQGQVLAVIASQEIADLQASMRAAQRRLELAKATYQREKTLWEEQISAKQDYLVARQAWQEAEIRLQNAQQKLRAFGDGAAAGGNRYELRAPFDGIVIAKHIVMGENVSGLSTGAASSANSNEANSAFTISDLSRVWATFNITSHDLRQVNIGKTVRVQSPDLDMQVSGTVTYVGSLLGLQTRAATARVTLENPQGSWRPGLFVSVEVEAETHTASVTVPETAIQTVDQNPVVFLRVASGFKAQKVVLGRRSNGRVELTQGVSAGQEVATRGSFVLKSMLGSNTQAT